MRELYRAIWLWLLLLTPSWAAADSFTKLLQFADEPTELARRDEELDAHGALLVKAVVLFRHGARTPLSDRYATAALSFGGKAHSARRRALHEATAGGGASQQQEQPRQLQQEFDLVSSSLGRSGVHWGRPRACEYTVQGPPLELRSQPGAPPLRPDDVAEMEAALLCEGPISPAAPLPASLMPGGGGGGAQGRGSRDTTPLPRGCGRGQLTRLGYTQAVALGRWLRSRYGVTTAGLAQHLGNGSSTGSGSSSGSSSGKGQGQGGGLLLPPARRRYLHPLPPAPIAARSTHVSRALLTLQGVLEGLLPLHPSDVNGSAATSSPHHLHHHLLHHHSPYPQQQAHPHEHPFGRHPVPVAVAPAGHQLLYANTDQCPRLAQLARLADLAAQVLGDADSTGDERRVRAALGLPPQRPDTPSTWLSWKRLLDAAMCEEAARGEQAVAGDAERLLEQLQSQQHESRQPAQGAAAGGGSDSGRRREQHPRRTLLRHEEKASAAETAAATDAAISAAAAAAAAEAQAGAQQAVAHTPAQVFEEYLSRVVGGSRTADLARQVRCDGGSAGGGGAGSHEGDGQGRLQRQLLLSSSAAAAAQRLPQQLGLEVEEAGSEEVEEAQPAWGQAGEAEEGAEAELADWEQASVGGRAQRVLAGSLEGRDGEDEDEEEDEDGDTGGGGGLTADLYSVVDWQATRRVAAVLGPPCNGTGLCQQLLQLGIGLLLRELLDGLRAAAAAAEARLQAAAAAAGAAAVAAAEQGFPGAAPEGGAAVGVAPVAMLDLYSGHDSTLMPLLAALGNAVGRWPPFVGNLVIELYRVPFSSSSSSSSRGDGSSNGDGSSKAAGGDAGAWMRSPEYDDEPEPEEQQQQEEEHKEPRDLGGKRGHEGGRKGESGRGAQRRRSAAEWAAAGADASGALAAAVKGQARAAVRRQRRRKLVRGGAANGADDGSSSGSSSSTGAGSSSSSSSSDVWAALWQGSNFGGFAASQSGSSSSSSGSGSGSSSSDARRRLAAAAQQPGRRWRASVDDAEAAGDSLLLALPLEAEAAAPAGMGLAAVRALLQAGGQQGAGQGQREQQQQQQQQIQQKIQQQEHAGKGRAQSQGEDQQLEQHQQLEQQQQQQLEQLEQQPRRRGLAGAGVGDAEYRVRLLYNLEELAVHTPAEGYTWLPRLSDLESLLRPYTVARPAYVSACRHVEDLVGLLEAQIGKSGAAASHGHFFDGDQEAAQAEHKRLQRERVEQLRRQRSQAAKAAAANGAAAAAAKAEKARQQQQQQAKQQKTGAGGGGGGRGGVGGRMHA